MKDTKQASGPDEYVKISFRSEPGAGADIILADHAMVVKMLGNSVCLSCPACHRKIFIQNARIERMAKCPECGLKGIISPMTSLQ